MIQSTLHQALFKRDINTHYGIPIIMKPTDFIPTQHPIGQAANEMHVDHEIQMAREECYHAATNAIELHRMLRHVSEQEGLQAWASEKISIANDYLRTVKEWLEYELATKLETSVSNENMLDPGMLEDASSGATSSGSMSTSMAGAGELFGGKKKLVKRKSK